ncbi:MULTISPECIES: penicillin-binding protein activator LpoB [Pseudomonas]|uniref:penicillin-binding protein activator LpoB n=1 Tax=Pseudomonas TaxID=286 RepID=UPI000CF32170|nr:MULTISPECIES: penicillin-binding protein activator LpoB [unclassified Pseudomonas]NMY95759.1 SPOR domain-containing protein [Pseudomonas proteolytica]NMZ09111.1 SPOR domain-containing protein [Pseudomonas proteolytica]NMZ12438.1 SPOR domain-containing protein [Pseudomonas proteolytica]NMZ39192.1 SPOR domain-containing protein [Pseudomonas proteolytica]QHG24768.1 SPOR domain-containing protein [Pseudomonas sp. DTU12.1]
MRKVAMAIVVLALAGCGEGPNLDTPRDKAEAAKAQAPAVAAVQWDILVRSPDNKLQALTDLTAWLLENGFTFYLAKEDGKDLVLLGPFASKAEAEARQVQLQERLVKKKKTDAESLVIEHKARQ